MPTDDQFLNTKEVAEVLGVHQKTVHLWLRAGKLAGTKISYRAWRIPRSALNEFIAKNSNIPHKDTPLPEQNSLQKTIQTNILESGNTSDNLLPGKGMKHYIRDIMGENENGPQQTE